MVVIVVLSPFSVSLCKLVPQRRVKHTFFHLLFLNFRFSFVLWVLVPPMKFHALKSRITSKRLGLPDCVRRILVVGYPGQALSYVENKCTLSPPRGFLRCAVTRPPQPE